MKLILQVLKPGSDRWSDLQPFEYDDANKFKTRKSVMKRAQLALMRWQGNYAQFRDAKFRIVDSEDMPISAPLKHLRHHVTGAIQRGEKQAIVEVPARRKVEHCTFKTNPAKLAAEHERELSSLETSAFEATARNGYNAALAVTNDWPKESY